MRKTSRKSFLAILLVLGLQGTLWPEIYAANLGIGVKPIPKVMIDDNAKLTENSNLWFVVDDGKSLSREILLRGSAIDQKVNLAVVSATDNNGQLTPSRDISEVAKFAYFSENDFILRANQNKVIGLKIEVPKGTPSQAFNAYLAVTVGATLKELKDDKPAKSNVQAIVRNQIRTLLRMFVGIGSYKDFFTDLQIEDVKDYSISRKKFLDVVIKNTGKTPITPSGEVSFSSLDFAGLRFGPISYLTLTMEPGKTSKFKMRVPDELEPGNWQILVKAQQGNIIRTKIFEKNLKFREGVNWFNLISRLISACLAIILFYYLRRNYSLTKRGNSIDGSPKKRSSLSQFEKFLSRFRIRSRESQETIGAEDFDIDKFLNELKSTTSKKATSKKATSKKATSKKATSKKATSKKATSKKATSK